MDEEQLAVLNQILEAWLLSMDEEVQDFQDPENHAKNVEPGHAVGGSEG